MLTRRRFYFAGIYVCLGIWACQILFAQSAGDAPPATDAAKTEAKADTPAADAPKADEPKADAPAEPPKADAPASTMTPDAAAPAPDAAAGGAAAPPPLELYQSPTISVKDDKGGDVVKFPDPIGGNAGYWTTPSAGPVGDGDLSAKTPTELYNRIAHNLFSINMMWVLLCGALVMFMQLGFAMVETGLCRAKNSAHTVAMNFMIYPLGCIAFYVYGFALGWGGWWNAPVPDGWYSPIGPGTVLLDKSYTSDAFKYKEIKDGQEIESEGKWSFIGTNGFFLTGKDDVSVLALFFFMMVFMDTTATIPTGTMCERWAWNNFLLYGLWVALPYCIYAHWVWGGGWLAQMGKFWGLGHGAVDFAGSGVVHAMGGAIGLAGCLVIGPRIGKYKDGKPQPIPGHHVPMVIFGTFVLAFGWFGFNAGSTLSGTDLRISVVVVNTMLASVFAAVGAHLALTAQGMKPDPTMLCNGMLAGLVAITAPCAFVDTWVACMIGAIAGVLVVFSVFFFEKLGVDDPCGAISVHGVNGTFGVIALGLFANGKYGLGFNGVERGIFDESAKKFTGGDPALIEDGVRGLFYGDASQLTAQLISAVTVWVVGFGMAYVWFNLSNLITPLRVSKETEIAGCDGPEMGTIGYADFTVNSK